MNRSVCWPLLSAGLLLLIGGCGGQDLSARAKRVRTSLHQARDRGAYVCAPRELALAEAHLEFSKREEKQGEDKRALQDLEVAEDSVRDALRRSAACAKNQATGPASTLDSDGDGVPDFRDRCPKVAEDMDGFQDEDGCPDTDNDEDGVPDAYDRCPNEPEDDDGFDDEDGCPDTDNDHDGITDRDDKCPNQPGPPEARGCPTNKTYGHLVLTRERIELQQPVSFAPGKAVIDQRSFALLGEIADVLKAHPAMRIRVEAHTDSRGTPAENKRLSQSRADVIKKHLAGRGIAPSRMVAEGFGSEQPIETNKTKAGREKNQRVEFVILQQ
jgi:outer membrane protein OmpA-like peptidoglycan-associated protein